MKGKQVLPGQVADQQCGGKICYITESAALNAMKSAREKRGNRKIHKERRVYQCPSCHFWHVTSLSISMKNELRSQSKDREEAFRGIENTLSGSLPADEAFEVLKRMNSDRVAGKEMRPVGIYIKKEEKRKKRKKGKKSHEKSSSQRSKKTN